MSDQHWKPRVLTQFEIGQAMAAIEGVARLEKPLAEVGTRVGTEEDFESDLRACAEMVGEAGRVLPWVRRVGNHVRFGYYAEPWALEALDFLERTDLEPRDRDWINGLLFGYRAAAIQRFLDRSAGPDTTARPSGYRPSTAETARPF